MSKCLVVLLLPYPPIIKAILIGGEKKRRNLKPNALTGNSEDLSDGELRGLVLVFVLTQTYAASLDVSASHL